MKHRIDVYTKWTFSAFLIGICGCTGVALHSDYADYSKVYADSSNKQLLLNLARESHQEPVYFIQLASISSQYQFSSSAGFIPSASRVNPPSVSGAAANLVQHTLTYGGTVTAGVTQTPVFQFLPLTGSNFVQAILSPISDKVFWTFYDQGWPADWVARTMLSSIQEDFDDTPTNESAKPDTLPRRVRTEVYLNDPTDPTYPKFLEYCNDLYNAQLFHVLSVDKLPKDGTPIYIGTNAALKDLVGAIAAGLSVKYNTNINNVIVTAHNDSTSFLIKSNEDAQVLRFYKYFSNYTYTNVSDAQTNFTNALVFANDFHTNRIRLTTRTFEEALNAVANEETTFEEYEHTNNLLYSNNITFTKDPYGTIAIVTPTNSPRFFVRPILMIRYALKPRSKLSKLVEVDYEYNTYSIGDLEDVTLDPKYADVRAFDPNRAGDLAYQNRTVFSLLSYLFSQATIDTSKLPIQQLIQVQ